MCPSQNCKGSEHSASSLVNFKNKQCGRNGNMKGGCGQERVWTGEGVDRRGCGQERVWTGEDVSLSTRVQN